MVWKWEVVVNPLFYFPAESVIQLSCGSDHTLALSCDGRVYGWGDNRCGQIGCGRGMGKIIAHPFHLQTFIQFSVKQLKTFCDQSFALTTDGLIYSWGLNNLSCLGHDYDENEIIFEPKLIVNIPKMIFISPSDGNTYFLTNERELYFCGFFRDEENEELYQMKPKLLKTEKKFSSLHSISQEVYFEATAVYGNEIYTLDENEIKECNYSSYFDYYSNKYELCYKTIHINSENIFDGNDLNDLPQL